MNIDIDETKAKYNEFGLAHWLVLRPYISKSDDWILNHAVGWVVGFTFGLFFVKLLSKTPLGMLVGFMYFGLIVALFQYPLLRREIPHLDRPPA